MLVINTKPDDVTLELQNGQHRVTAMLTLLQEAMKRADQGERVVRPTTNDYHWAINVYALELLTLESAAALSANREIVHKSNSEGFNAIQIITHFDNVPEPEKPAILKPKALGTWLNNIFGLHVDHTARMLTVLSHDTFRPLFLRYCMTQYGEHTFSWTFATKIVSSHLDFVWKPPPSFPFMKRTILTVVRFGSKSWTNSFHLANRFLIQKCKLSQKMTGG